MPAVEEHNITETAAAMPAARPRIPTLVKIIALFYLLSGLLGIIGAFAVELFGMWFGQFSPFRAYGTWGAVAIFVFALIALMISRGLKYRHNWARLTAAALSVVSAASALYHFQSDIGHAVWQLVVNLAIVSYLLFNHRVRAAFTKEHH